jgi:hypothetical protein
MTEAKAIPGSCLCGVFRFEVLGSLADVNLCHCDICRRANGTAFSANCPVPVERFKALTDYSTIAEYSSSPGAWRAFCKNCGSPVYARKDSDAGVIRLRLGSLDRTASANIVSHVWVGSKANWDRISDDLPCYERGAHKDQN